MAAKIVKILLVSTHNWIWKEENVIKLRCARKNMLLDV